MIEVASLLYQGHGSFRIITEDKTVIYVDPYVGEGYDIPGDYILVTHQHGDHNRTDLPAKKEDTRIITHIEALTDGKHNIIKLGNITVEAVEAYNKNHNPEACVGYMITVDGVCIYAAGDTSKTTQMETFAKRHIDYALLPCDGVYNMDLPEAAECARIIGACHNIPIHMKPGELFDRSRAENFNAPNRLILEPGEEIVL